MVWDDWASTAGVSVTNPPGVDDFAVKIEVAYQNGMRSDFADLRFSLNGVAIPHTIWSYTASTEAEVWVKIPSGTTSFTLHYGNADASDASDPDETFLFCDRFTGYIADHWEHIYRGQSDSSTTINGSDQLVISPPTDTTPGSMRGLVSKTTFSKGIVVEYNDKLVGNTFHPGITIGYVYRSLIVFHHLALGGTVSSLRHLLRWRQQHGQVRQLRSTMGWCEESTYGSRSIVWRQVTCRQ